jgi:hypothetical protein
MRNILIATLLGFVASLVVGMVMFTLYYNQLTTDLIAAHPGCFNAEPNMVIGFSGALVQCLLFAIFASKAGYTDLRSGAINGAWFGGLIWLMVNLNQLAIFSVVEPATAMIDTLISLGWSGVTGAVIGWSLGRFNK